MNRLDAVSSRPAIRIGGVCAAGALIVSFALSGVAPSQERHGQEAVGQKRSGGDAAELGESLQSIGPISLWGASYNGYQQVTVIDSRTNRLAVYHVAQATGEIELKSVRDVTWDLKLDHFNGVDPLPRAIRGMTDR